MSEKPLTAPCLLCNGHGWSYSDLGDLYLAMCREVFLDLRSPRPVCPRCGGLGQDPDAPRDDDEAETWYSQVVALRDEAEAAGCAKDFAVWMQKAKVRGAVYPEHNAFDVKSLSRMQKRKKK